MSGVYSKLFFPLGLDLSNGEVSLDTPISLFSLIIKRMKILRNILVLLEDKCLPCPVGFNIGSLDSLVYDLSTWGSSNSATGRGICETRILVTLRGFSQLSKGNATFQMIFRTLLESMLLMGPVSDDEEVESNLYSEISHLTALLVFRLGDGTRVTLPTSNPPPVHRTRFPNYPIDYSHRVDQRSSSAPVFTKSRVIDLSNLGLESFPVTAPPESGLVSVWVKDGDLRVLSLDVFPTSTIGDLKEVVASYTGVTFGARSLYHKDDEMLDDSLPLFKYFGDGERINLLVALLGWRRRGRVATDDVVEMKPFQCWFDFGLAYQDGVVGNGGRIRHALAEFQFNGEIPGWWFTDQSLRFWEGLTLQIIDDDVEGMCCLIC